jgi:enoyl-CoA hydratase/carnithine racemase
MISVAVADHVATVTIDRPPVNAIDIAGFAEVRDAFRGLSEDRDVRVAIFTATGDRAFMAGVDLRDADKLDAHDETTRPAVVLDPGRRVRDAFDAVRECAVPVIGAINGPALGAGLGFAACCDVLIAAEGASFGLPEINVGLLGGSAHLSTLVGRHKARELFFTGETISAAELQRLGAVRAVVPRAELMDEARALAASLAAKSPIALRLAKEAMNRVEGLPTGDAYRIEQEYTRRLQRFDDAAEARRAYLDKRPPEWHWR